MTDTTSKILDVAAELIQTVGFNAFSFRDLAGRVGISSASVHYHFPTKQDLCLAIIARYRDGMRAAMAAIDADGLGPPVRLRRYVRMFQETIDSGNRMCLCGMLASDVGALTPSARDALRDVFGDHEAWLTGVLEAGRASGELEFPGAATTAARMLVAGLEGALLVARTFGDRERFATLAEGLLGSIDPQARGRDGRPGRRAPARVGETTPPKPERSR